MDESKRIPIIYQKEQDIRFGELDPYGHLSAKHYLDLVASSRLLFLERDLGYSLEKLTAAGFAFYLRKATQNFRVPIVGLQRIMIKSFVSKAEGSLFVIDFDIQNEKQTKTHASGQLEYVVVDMKTQRPTSAPDWLTALFFKDKDASLAPLNS